MVIDAMSVVLVGTPLPMGEHYCIGFVKEVVVLMVLSAVSHLGDAGIAEKDADYMSTSKRWNQSKGMYHF